MHDFRFVTLDQFKALPWAEQRQYLKGLKAHFDAIKRIHEQTPQPHTLVPRPDIIGPHTKRRT